MGSFSPCLLLPVALSLLFAASPLTACPPDHVAIETRSGTEIIHVEIADDPLERAAGLSGRDTLTPGSGMLFLYETPHRAWFWMKGTNVALDIIFIDSDRTITAIKQNAHPGSYWPKSGGSNTLSVLEINGGEADTLGIEVGDLVQQHRRQSSDCGG
ncbi:DUF192 domain-containing protein [Phaeobacter sp. A90a-4k]|uniref:DUF192 domain-containing protein n=1 Tax=unclassified Phaeobacter TaxID=2621772 RepID=UPI003A8BAEE4